ncbi:MAG: ATP-binding cassette domain-containing protein [Clostridiales bacterium]|nr:ATP-binding cassette domain-containing protein [Clostridiales bacterium]MDY4007954.1 ATP-binding cassette domain-containing protein [Candidatus Limiplasma sp.]
MSEYALEMLGISKSFSKVRALNDVNLRIRKGEIHALIGENGAGKSTLMKILTGIYKADAGVIKLDGQEVHFKKPQDTIDAGIAIIHQELSMIPDLNAVENLMLGHEMQRGGVLKIQEEYAYAKKYLDYVSNGTISSYRSIVAIRRELEKRSIPSPTGKKGWCARAIDTLLSNEKYRGNSTATAPLTSYETKSAQRSRYMYSKHHIAIIDDAQFEAVAEEKKRRSNIEYDETGVHRKSTRYTVKIKINHEDGGE